MRGSLLFSDGLFSSLVVVIGSGDSLELKHEARTSQLDRITEGAEAEKLTVSSSSRDSLMILKILSSCSSEMIRGGANRMMLM